VQPGRQDFRIVDRYEQPVVIGTLEGNLYSHQFVAISPSLEPVSK
jgi:hypothetical protein